jgi:AraC-like DNA-binding protein
MQADGSEKIEWVRFWHPSSVPGVEIMDAANWTDPCVVYHERYTVCTMLKNDLEWKYRRRLYEGGPGRLMVMEPGEAHVTTAVRGPGTFAVFMIDPEVVRPIASALGIARLPHLDPAKAVSPQLWTGFARLHRVLGDATLTTLHRQTAMVESVRILLSQCAEAAPGNISSFGGRAVARALDHIHDSLALDVDLDELAGVAGVSPCYLSREFRRVVGVPQHRYQLLVRVERARALLKRGMALSEAAIESGFCDQSHMSKWFKKVLGVTPAAYVKAT